MSARSPRLRDIRSARFPELDAYWTDPAYRARIDAETEHERRLTHARIDRGMEPHNQRQAQAWADNGEV